MNVVARGVDAATEISLATLGADDFICLYLAPQSQLWKVRNKTTINSYLNAGKKLVFNYESSGQPGEDGAAAANRSNQILYSYDLPAHIVPVYFNFADVDPTTINYTLLDQSIDAARSIVGFDRMGGYGGYAVIKHLFDTNRIKYGWQTYAWSHGQWDPRAQLRQTLNGQIVDLDEAWAIDYGQYPRPSISSHNAQQELFLI